MDDFDDMTIDYRKVVDSKEMLAVTRLLAASIQVSPYMRVGTFIQELSSGDLQMLNDIVESGAEHPRFEELLLISEMLARAEGLTTESIDDMTTRTSMLATMLTLESLFRKGLIDLYHENMSFGDDSGDKLVAKLKDDPKK